MRRLNGVRLLGSLALVLILMLALKPMGDAGAILPQDYLREGQDLVEEATALIDARVSTLRGGSLDAETLYMGLVDLFDAVHQFNSEQVSDRYALDCPEGLMVTDGIADTLATRTSWLLRDYIDQNLEELLTRGRQALEMLLVDYPLPPGRFLGFHFQRLAHVYAEVADTVLTKRNIGDPAGVYDGFLRRVWDLSQVYDQMHANAGEKYFCRIRQEDLIAHRMRCKKCGRTGLKMRNQRFGLSEMQTPDCQEVFASTDTSRASIIKRFACRSWGHIFETVCPDCGAEDDFSVRLPYYRILQLRVALGEERFPDPEELYLSLPVLQKQLEKK